MACTEESCDIVRMRAIQSLQAQRRAHQQKAEATTAADVTTVTPPLQPSAQDKGDDDKTGTDTLKSNRKTDMTTAEDVAAAAVVVMAPLSQPPLSTSGSSSAMSEEEIDLIGRSVAIIHVSGFEKSLSAPWLPGERTGGTGTGWFVRPPWQSCDSPVRYLFTCFHVVETANPDIPIKIQTVYTDKQRIPARVVAAMPQVDAALLEILDEEMVKRNTFRSWPVGDSKMLRAGAKLSVYGYPLGMDRIKVLDMMLNGIQDGSGQVDGAINPGHSGAPVVHQGQVVGFITSGIPSLMASNTSFFQLIAYVKALWHNIVPRQGHQVIRWGRLGLEYQNSTLSFLEMVGTGPSQRNADTGQSDCASGVVVQHVSTLSPLAKEPVHIEPLDVLCSFEATIDGTEYAFVIDNEGDVDVPWYKEKMHLPDVLHMIRKGDPIMFHVWKTQTQKLLSQRIVLPELNVNGFHTLYPPYDPIPYVAFAGLLVEPMSSNVRQSFRQLYKCTEYEDIEKPALVIVDIFGNSAADETKVLPKGSVITHVNGTAVDTLEQYRAAMVVPQQNKYITIRTKTNAYISLPLDRVVEEEVQLSKEYGYPVEEQMLRQLSVLHSAPMKSE